MEAAGVVFVGVVVVALVIYLAPRFFGSNYNVCTRCEGSGHIDERWPDPASPGGFHVAEGKCPRCKGKGKVRV